MENTTEYEIVSSSDDRTDECTAHDMDVQSDEYHTLQRNRQTEHFELDKSKQEIASGSRKCISRRRATILTVVVIAIIAIIAIIIAVIFLIIRLQAEKDECATQPCLNGYCNDLVNGYECWCFAGFRGRHCKKDMNECVSNPCLHGTCTNLVGGYNCTCFAGYAGLDCQTDIDECSSNECVNGTCIDGIGNYSCSCNKGFGGNDCDLLTDCVDILHYIGRRTDGNYTVRTWKRHQWINVYCDMTTDYGGWTVFQYRFDGSTDFYRNFSEYNAGFGNLTTEFWLGLSNIKEIADQGLTDLRIDLEASNGTKAYETFDNFYLSPAPGYTLHLGRTIASFRISSEHSFGNYHNGSDFSTYDHDADSYPRNCATIRHGAWWYKNCSTASLNGKYQIPGTWRSNGIIYNSFTPGQSLKTSKMMIRRK